MGIAKTHCHVTTIVTLYCSDLVSPIDLCNT
uniref:Uncharacterized protein n=1 Tax=Rhizophora mucronata TaxID=61149 RepID=A0A2P2NDJ6_RHIMU